MQKNEVIEMINNITSLLTTTENLILIIIPIIFIILIEYINIVFVWMYGIGSTVHYPGRGVYHLRLKQNGQILAALIFFLEMNIFTIDSLWILILSLIFPIIHLIPTFIPGIYITTCTFEKKCEDKDFEKWFKAEQKLSLLDKEYEKSYKRLQEIFEEKYSTEELVDEFKDLERMIEFIKRPTSEEEDKCEEIMNNYYDTWNSIPWYIKDYLEFSFKPKEMGLSPNLLAAGIFI